MADDDLAFDFEAALEPAEVTPQQVHVELMADPLFQ